MACLQRCLQEPFEEAEAVARQLEAGAVTLNDAALTALFHEAEKQSFKASGLGPSRMGAAGLLRFFPPQGADCADRRTGASVCVL